MEVDRASRVALYPCQLHGMPSQGIVGGGHSWSVLSSRLIGRPRMAGECGLTVIGNLTSDPELRFTASGAAVTSFTIAQNSRHYDKASSEWVDNPPLFIRCSGPWRDSAERVSESLHKGDRVVVVGKLVQRAWETAEGDKRSSYELDVEEVSASLRYANVSIRRPARQGEEVSASRHAPAAVVAA